MTFFHYYSQSMAHGLMCCGDMRGVLLVWDLKVCVSVLCGAKVFERHCNFFSLFDFDNKIQHVQ